MEKMLQGKKFQPFDDTLGRDFTAAEDPFVVAVRRIRRTHALTIAALMELDQQSDSEHYTPAAD